MNDQDHPAPPSPRIASLCSGYGGLELAVTSVLGGTPVWFAETDPAARAVLAARWPDVPVYGDIRALDWTTLPPADLMAAGYPCQPYATQGQKKGTTDERDLGPEVVRAARVLRPALIFLENVPAHRHHGFTDVIGELSASGYDAEWCCVGAAETGAPHRRTRLFAALRPSASPANPARGRERDAGPEALPLPVDGRHGFDGRPSWLEHRRRAVRGVGEPPRTGTVPDLPATRCEKPLSWQQYGAAVRRWEECTMVAPPCPIAPVGVNGRDEVAPAFLEWMQGLPLGWVSSVPGLDYRDAYRLIGNGVCPPQAAAALSVLLDRLDEPAPAVPAGIR